jgi:hypothetical protein
LGSISGLYDTLNTPQTNISVSSVYGQIKILTVLSSDDLRVFCFRNSFLSSMGSGLSRLAQLGSVASFLVFALPFSLISPLLKTCISSGYFGLMILNSSLSSDSGVLNGISIFWFLSQCEKIVRSLNGSHLLVRGHNSYSYLR